MYYEHHADVLREKHDITLHQVYARPSHNISMKASIYFSSYL